MKYQKKIVLAGILFAFLISSCVCFNPIYFDWQTDQSISTMYEMISYLPVNIVEDHPPYFINVAVTYIDFEQMHKKLNIPKVNGDSSREEKAQAARAYQVQGIPAFPDDLYMYTYHSYEEYGWDFSNVSHSMMMIPYDTAFLKGDFDVEKIERALEKLDYEKNSYQNFIVFESEANKYTFAVSDHMMIIAPDSEIVVGAIQQKQNPQGSAVMNEYTRQLVENTKNPFGFVLLASGDLSQMDIYEYYEEKILYFKDINSYQYQWELMMISYEADEKEAELQIDYAFPSQELADANTDAVKNTITNTPYLNDVNYKIWADAVHVKKIKQLGNMIEVTATTNEEDLIGDAFENGNFFGFLPARKITEDF